MVILGHSYTFSQNSWSLFPETQTHNQCRSLVLIYKDSPHWNFLFPPLSMLPPQSFDKYTTNPSRQERMRGQTKVHLFHTYSNECDDPFSTGSVRNMKENREREHALEQDCFQTSDPSSKVFTGLSAKEMWDWLQQQSFRPSGRDPVRQNQLMLESVVMDNNDVGFSKAF